MNFNLDFITLIYNIFLNETHNLLWLKLNGEKQLIFNKKYFIQKKYYKYFKFQDFFSKIFLISTKKRTIIKIQKPTTMGPKRW